jgi:hypothetical protein
MQGNPRQLDEVQVTIERLEHELDGKEPGEKHESGVRKSGVL